MHAPQSKCAAVLLLALVLLGTVTWQARAQFFTKTSKSIPRMGRRADNLISDQLDLRDASMEKRSGSNLDSLKEFVSNLVHIRKFIQDSVFYYRHKLRKRS